MFRTPFDRLRLSPIYESVHPWQDPGRFPGTPRHPALRRRRFCPGGGRPGFRSGNGHPGHAAARQPARPAAAATAASPVTSLPMSFRSVSLGMGLDQVKIGSEGGPAVPLPRRSRRELPPPDQPVPDRVRRGRLPAPRVLPVRRQPPVHHDPRPGCAEARPLLAVQHPDDQVRTADEP